MPFLNVFCESYNWWWKYWDICLLEEGWDAYFLPAWKEKLIPLASFFIKLPGVGVSRGCRAWTCMKQWRLLETPHPSFSNFPMFLWLSKKISRGTYLIQKRFLSTYYVQTLLRALGRHWTKLTKVHKPLCPDSTYILMFQRPRPPRVPGPVPGLRCRV